MHTSISLITDPRGLNHIYSCYICIITLIILIPFISTQVVIPWPVKVRDERCSQGLAYLHTTQGDERKNTVTHGDLIAANILADEKYSVKVCVMESVYLCTCF